MIENESSNIGSILNSVNIKTSEVADLLRAEVPSDMYHSVVSSSFDADRLDYFQRDRYMTGVGSGAIDLSWLMDNVRVADIDVSAVGGEDDKPIYTHSFCLGLKAKEAAEDFLLSRYRLYSNVYFHKTTRGFEKLVAAFFRIIANKVRNNVEVKGLYPDHPLLKFFQKGGDSLDNYLRIDDSVVVGAMHPIAWFGDGPEVRICEMYLTRQRPFCLDVQYSKPNDAEAQRHLKHWLNEEFSEKLDEVVFYDNIKLSLYGEIGADDSKAQKRLMILLPTGRPREITEFGDSLIKGGQQRVFDRYYFINNQDYEKAIAKAKEV